jgi:hypothetical protein
VVLKEVRHDQTQQPMSRVNIHDTSTRIKISVSKQTGRSRFNGGSWKSCFGSKSKCT